MEIDLVRIGKVFTECKNCHATNMQGFKGFAFNSDTEISPIEFYVNVCEKCLHPQFAPKF